MTIKRLFAGNKLASFGRTVDAIAEGTNPVTFNSTYVSNSIALPGSAVDYMPTAPFTDASSTTTLWMRAEWYGQPTDTYRLLEFVNSTGTVVAKFQCDVGAGGFQFLYWNGAAFVALGSTVAIAVNILQQLTFKIVAGAGGSIKVWKSDVLVVDATGGDAAFDNIAQVRFHGGSALYSFWSRIIGFDSDIRDFQFIETPIDGEGTHTDGSGVYTDVNETPIDESTAILLPAVNDTHTFTKAPLTLPGGYIIDSAWINGRVRVNGGTVTDAEMVYRSGGTDYPGPGVSAASAYEPRMYNSPIDPDTGIGWTEAGYNAAEVGVKAV